MSKIQDYYDFIDKFKGDLKPRLQTELEQLEDSLIAEEILPAISESVAPVLGILRRHLTLVVDYDPEGGITVKTTRGKVEVDEPTAKKYLKSATYRVSWEFTCKTTKILLLYIFLGHNRNVVNTKFPYPIKRLEVIRRFNQKSMTFNQSLS